MDAANVIIGSGVMRVAPIGTTLPTLDGTVYPIVWPAGWETLGYTDDGVELTYAPTFKEIMVDEEMSPVKMPLIGEKATLIAKLAEATLENLNRAIAGSTVEIETAEDNDTITFKVGSSAEDNEMMVGFEGPAPGDQLTRVIIGYRAKATGTIGMKHQRTDKVIIPLEFQLLADATKDAGERLFKIVDVGPDVAS